MSDVETAFLEKLKTCGTTEQCQLAVVRAIGNARLSGTVPLLAELALTSTFASVSEAALNALLKIDSEVLSLSDVVSNII